MPIPDQRDPALTRKQLTDWLATKGTDVWVSDPSGPAATGFSNETILFDARWTEGGERHEVGLVARVAPTMYHLFLEPRFDVQYRVMKALDEHTDVPMPRIRWFEDDASWLGAPFWVMDKVDGDIPGDNPPYTMTGFLFDASPAEQERLYMSGLDAMCQVHTTDWRALGLDFLDRPAYGATGLDQELGYYREYLAWTAGDKPLPLAAAALEWLEQNRAPEPALRLCWGDSRIGNQIFAGFECQAVLDWEMVLLGDPVMDLAWWLFLDRHHTEGLSVPRLPGFPSREATIERWQAATGGDATHVDYYEVLAGMRFSVIMGRLSDLLIEYELLPPDADMRTNNIPAQLTAKMLDLPPPGDPQAYLTTD
jgi:aminoglycoside phosphotransferase (APT) family kinase protein